MSPRARRVLALAAWASAAWLPWSWGHPAADSALPAAGRMPADHGAGWRFDVPLSKDTTKSPKDGDTALLPDLRTLSPSGLLIQHFADRRLLRLANTVWNSGRGPLELSGVIPRETEATPVHQIIYAADGVVGDRYVGSFIWHASHGHWHIEEFARYELWSLGPTFELDRVMAASTKVSYCLIDTQPVALDSPAAPAAAVYRGCGRTRQGLSVGWGDEYKAHLDGQEIELGDLPDGIYGLVSTVNPGRQLVEEDYTNNSATVYLALEGSHVTVMPSTVVNKMRRLAAGDW